VHRPPPIHCAAVTELGRVRSRNEDCIHIDPQSGLVAVADGMGGHLAGDVASRLAIAALVAAMRVVSDAVPALPPTLPRASPADLLQSAVAQANAQVFAAANTLPGCIGMGTTLLAAWFTRTGDGTPQLVIAHVGDSRLYRYRKSASGTGELQPLTRDHTTVQELIDGGLYPPEEVRRLVRRNYLTRAIGIEPTVDSDLRTLPVAADDLFILCSDGLSGLLENSQILAVIAQHPDPAHRDLQSLAQQLADAANERGGHDNISVVLARLATSSLPSA